MRATSVCQVRFASAIDFASMAGSGISFNLSGKRIADKRGGGQSTVATDAELSQDEIQFVAWLLGSIGVDIAAYRTSTFARRIPACLRALRAKTIDEARRKIERDRSLIDAPASALLLGVTQFFRDAHVFSTLRDVVLPRLFATQSRVRIWSAGCSNGAELFSLAMLIDERGRDELPHCDLLGTDVRGAAIRRASEGRFPLAELASLSADRLHKHFERVLVSPPWAVHLAKRSAKMLEARVVSRSLRRVTRWRCANVLNDVEPGQWDLILCRNMAMYTRQTTSQDLWRRLEASLRPGGFLVLGTAERPSSAKMLELVAPCVFQRRHPSMPNRIEVESMVDWRPTHLVS